MNTVRSLLVGDQHFKRGNLVEADIFIENLKLVITKVSPDNVIFMGDFTDEHDLIDMQCLVKIVRCVKDVAKMTKVFLIIGNHDRLNNKDYMSDIHPFTALVGHKNVTVVDKAIAVNFIPTDRNPDATEGANFLFVPYVEPGRFEEALKTINLNGFKGGYKSPDIDAIFAHQEFYRAQMGPIKSKTGDKWSKKYPMVFSGHIHDRQFVNADPDNDNKDIENNILYVGTPYQQSHADRDNKTLEYLEFNLEHDRESEDVKRLECCPLELDNPSPKIRCKSFRISLGMKKKKIIRINASELKILKINPEDDIRVVISGDKDDIKMLTKSKDIKDLQNKNVLVSLVRNREKKEEGKGAKGAKNDPNTPYLAIFFSLIKGDKDVEEYFNKLFGIGKNKETREGREGSKKKKIIVKTQSRTAAKKKEGKETEENR